MHLEHLPSRFQKLGLEYYQADPASDQDVLKSEQRLNVSFPDQVKDFYRSYDGLRVEKPHLEVLPIARLNFRSPQRLHFANVDFNNPLFFDVSHINAAGQWDIRGEDDYLVTLTMASFWSNKIWAWVARGQAIWRD